MNVRTIRNLALTLALAAPMALAQAKPSITPDGSHTQWKTDQLVTLTVSEAWQMSGKNEDKFFDIVQQLAEFSAQKRGVTLPDTAAAGQQAGQYIKEQAKADHDQLLYSIVDRAIRRLGKTEGVAPAAPAKK